MLNITFLFIYAVGGVYIISNVNLDFADAVCVNANITMTVFGCEYLSSHHFPLSEEATSGWIHTQFKNAFGIKCQ